MDAFSAKEDEKLVNLVSGYSCLYNSTHETYKDQRLKDEVWEAIGKELNKGGEVCRKHWKNIRDGYKRFKRRNKLSTGLAAPKNSKTKWEIYRNMSFLDSISRRSTIKSNINSTVDESRCTHEATIDSPQSGSQYDTRNPLLEFGSDENSDDSSMSNISIERNRQKKIKHEYLDSEPELVKYLQKGDESHNSPLRRVITQKESNVEESDELDSFTTHIKNVLQKMPPILKIRAKQDLFEVLTKYEIIAVELSSNDLLLGQNNLKTPATNGSFHSIKLNGINSCEPHESHDTLYLSGDSNKFVPSVAAPTHSSGQQDEIYSTGNAQSPTYTRALD